MNTRVQRWIDKGMVEVTDYCWLWRGAVTTDGYPVVSYKGNCNARGHRIMYMLYNPEETIEGKVIRHACDNPLCVNPEHLLSGSPTDNMVDRRERGRTNGHVHNYEIDSVKLMDSLGYKRKRISLFTGIGIRRVEYILKKYVKA